MYFILKNSCKIGRFIRLYIIQRSEINVNSNSFLPFVNEKPLSQVNQRREKIWKCVFVCVWDRERQREQESSILPRSVTTANTVMYLLFRCACSQSFQFRNSHQRGKGRDGAYLVQSNTPLVCLPKLNQKPPRQASSNAQELFSRLH